MSSPAETRVQPLVIEPTEVHAATVIFVHGFGQSAESWIPLLRPLTERLRAVKWILPQAPHSADIHREGVRPSWYNIHHLPPCHYYDEAGVTASMATIEDLVLYETRRGTEPTKIILVGFSQGASLSLMTALTTLHELGGVASLSGWIPIGSRQAMQQMHPDLPVFWAHGIEDDEVPLLYGEDAISFLCDTLSLPQDRVVFRKYEGLLHDVNETELNDLGDWLQNIVGSE